MDKYISPLVGILTAIVGLAVIAVLVRSSNTGTIIKNAGDSFASVIKAATNVGSGFGG